MLGWFISLAASAQCGQLFVPPKPSIELVVQRYREHGGRAMWLSRGPRYERDLAQDNARYYGDILRRRLRDDPLSVEQQALVLEALEDYLFIEVQ